MAVEIDGEYRAKLKRIVQRNLQRDKPITNIFGMLAMFRSTSRELTKIANREFAMGFKEPQSDAGLWYRQTHDLKQPYLH